MISISLEEGKNIYFASDFHLGVPSHQESLIRERKIVSWLDTISPSAQAIFLVGDIFDFWFEHKRVIPKGFIRLQGKLAELSDNGIPIYLFRGNHDMWMFDYFEKEIGAKIFQEPQTISCNGKRIFIHHGDGLGNHDKVYKVFRKIFTNPICQWLYSRLHPNFSLGLAQASSQSSRLHQSKKPEKFMKEKEHLWEYCNQIIKTEHYDYFIMGHRHLPLFLPVGDKSHYINLGEWVNYSYYGIFDGDQLSLKSFTPCAPYFTSKDL